MRRPHKRRPRLPVRGKSRLVSASLGCRYAAGSAWPDAGGKTDISCSKGEKASPSSKAPPKRGRRGGCEERSGKVPPPLLACEVGEVDEVRGAGRVVEGEVPPPVLHPLVVVHEHPAQPLHVVRSDGAARGLVLPRHLELGRIVPLLPVPLAVPDGIHLRILLRLAAMPIFCQAQLGNRPSAGPKLGRLPRLQQLLHPRLAVVRLGNEQRFAEIRRDSPRFAPCSRPARPPRRPARQPTRRPTQQRLAASSWPTESRRRRLPCWSRCSRGVWRTSEPKPRRERGAKTRYSRRGSSRASTGGPTALRKPERPLSGSGSAATRRADAAYAATASCSS